MLVRVLAESMANSNSAVVAIGRTAVHTAADLAARARLGLSLDGGFAIGVVGLAIAFNLAWPLRAWSQMPLPPPAPAVVEAPPAAPAPPADEMPPNVPA